MTDYQKENQDKAQKLADELKQYGKKNIELIKTENGYGWHVFFTDNGTKYEARKNGHPKASYSVSRHPWTVYKYSTNNQQYEIRKKHPLNNVFTLNEKKLNALIDQENAINKETDELEKENEKKIETFLKEVDKLSPSYYYDWSTSDWNEKEEKFDRIRGDIKGGEITRNGIEFSFTIDRGYISKSIKLDYHPNADIETFEALADNKYKPKSK